MKSSTKLSIVFVFSISLLFSCSLLLWNANAQSSLQKVSLGGDSVRIQTQAGIPVIDVQLLENTDHCFTECYAILKIHPYQDISIPKQADSEFAWNFAKEKPWMDGLVSHHFEILETVEYAVDVPDYGTIKVNSTCYDQDNATYACEADQIVQTGSHQETGYRDEYKPFEFWGWKLKSGTDYTIKLVGNKPAKLGTNNIDWRPIIKGLELDEWEWWNLTCLTRQQILAPISSPYAITYVNGSSGVFGNPMTWENATPAYVYNCTYGSTPYYPIAGDITGAPQLNWENGTLSGGHNWTGGYNESGMSGFWKFDSSDNWLKDSTQWSDNGTAANSPSLNSNGKYGFAANFTKSTGDSIEIPNSEGVRVGNTMTMMGWVRMPIGASQCASDACTLISKQFNSGDSYPSYAIAWLTSVGVLMELSSDASTSHKVLCWNSSYVNLKDGNWHFIAGTYNGSYAVLYYDGVKQTPCSYSDGIGYNTDPLRIGMWRAQGTQYMDGDIDDVRLYNRALSDAEINDIYKNNLTALGETEFPCPSDDTYINQNTKFEPPNLFCNVKGIHINASNITLDCNGMTLNGPGSYIGILIPSFDNVTIKNCTIQNYNIGIDTLTSKDSRIEDNKIFNNFIYGIRLWASFSINSTLSNNNISNNQGDGIRIEFSKNINLINNIIKSNGEYDVELHNELPFETVNNSFLNTTYDTEHLEAVSGSVELTRRWYAMVNVTDRYMNPIQNAQVSVYNNSQDMQWTENTSMNGITDWNVVTQYIHRNESGSVVMFNQTPHTISVSHPNYKTYSITQNVTESQIIHIILMRYNITFNVTSGEDGSPLDNVNIACNYTGFSQGDDTTNPYGPYEFPAGWWSCEFGKINYYNKTVIFTADNDKTIDVVMSYKYHLTNEEHSWIESIYNCLINKNCDVYDLWNQTYEYASSIWDQFKQTDESVVVSEQTTSSVVNETSNLTIEYLIDVPAKEDYKFLPIRIFYWFMDENNETCYNQAKESNSAEAPFCNPLVAQAIGEVNTQINFTVDLRPSLPAGNYTIVRRIDIDPENVWINYGHEAIGRIEVTENSGTPEIKLSINGNSAKHEMQEPFAQATAQTQQPEQFASDKTTGMITVQQIDSVSYVAVIVSVITLILVGLMFKNSRKRTPWGN